MQPARGDIGEIILVMDSASWQGELGDELIRTFRKPYPGLPQEEPYFNVNYVNPLRLNSVLKSAKNMIFVTTFDKKNRASRVLQSNFTPESVEKIKNDSSYFMFTKKDEFARDQRILHLFAKNQKTLIRKIAANREGLRNYFEQIEKKRINNKIFKNSEKDIEQVIADKHGIEIKIPFGFMLAKNLKNFAWVRVKDAAIEKNIFIYHQPFSSLEPFQDIKNFREKITSSYLRDSEKLDLYITIQDEYPLQIKEVNFNDIYAKECRGLWKVSDATAGGPFLSYTFVDENTNRLYYIEGYVYAAGTTKRNFMREIEAILWTSTVITEEES